MRRFVKVRTLGLAALVAVAVLAAFPDAIRYLPYLILLACPLMMVFVHGHGGHGSHEMPGKAGLELGEYVCPMHAEVRSTFPGDCPDLWHGVGEDEREFSRPKVGPCGCQVGR
jgi:hypothetical protein